MALTLSRRAGERIRIGPSIWVTVAEVKRGGKVRLAIDAPREIPVDREELLPASERYAPLQPVKPR